MDNLSTEPIKRAQKALKTVFSKKRKKIEEKIKKRN